MAGKFNAGTMKVERGALLWCAFQWRRKPRWHPPPRKKQGDEHAKGAVDGRADPANRRRAVGNRLSARGAGAQRICGGKCFVGGGRIAAAFEWTVRGRDFRYTNAGSGEWSGSARVDSEKLSGTEDAHYPHQRRHGKQRYAGIPGAKRNTVHREAFSSAAIDINGGEDIRETMSDEMKTRLLVVDDEQSIRRLCMTIGNTLGYVCAEAESAETALARLESDAPDLLLTDLKLPNMSGVELLKQTRALLPHTEVAIMTGHGSIESAVDAMKLGAYDYIEKPFRVEKMRLLLQRMAEKVRLVTENEYLHERVTTEENLDGIIGTSANIQDVLRMISRLKDTRTPVLISGESGTGKELAARAIHFRGSMAKTPFVAVDCGSLVPTLMESELFGYEKGAFTGATKTKAGLFQAANGGTIFLDEIGELPQEMQAKLLRVLQEKEVRPVGSNTNVSVDVRVIAATNRDLEAAYRGGTFRKDLYFRLNVVTVHLPPLRERRSDVPVLVHHFLDRYAKGSQIQVTSAAMKSLLHYDWPGNVRELENCIARAVTLGDGKIIDVADLPPAIRSEQADSGIVTPQDAATQSTTALAEMERMTILRVFEQANGDKALAGKMLGISRATLYRKLKRYNIPVKAGSTATPEQQRAAPQ